MERIIETTAAVSTAAVSTATAVVSTATSSAGASAFLQDTSAANKANTAIKIFVFISL